jgi:Leucine-rich repeat (LRR) protein
MDIYNYILQKTYNLSKYELKLFINNNYFKFKYITDLTINNNNIYNIDIINELFNLKRLDISNNNLKTVPKLNLKHLEILICNNNKISELFNELKFCYNLKHISFNNNILVFCYITKLKFLIVDVSYNYLQDININTNKLIANNNKFNKLLDILHCNILDISFCNIYNVIYYKSQYNYLNISNNPCILYINKYNNNCIIIAKNIKNIINKYNYNISNIVL